MWKSGHDARLKILQGELHRLRQMLVLRGKRDHTMHEVRLVDAHFEKVKIQAVKDKISNEESLRSLMNAPR